MSDEHRKSRASAHESSDTPLPPDRSGILTEQRNPRSMRLHEMSVDECVALIQQEDRTIADAMARAREALSSLIMAIEPRFKQGGRVIYLGAGTSGRLGVLDASEMPPTYQIDPSRFVGIIAGGDASLRKSSEGREDEHDGAHDALRALALTPNDSVIGIAAGGTTPYVLGALEFAAQRLAAAGQMPAHQETSRGVDHAPLSALISCAPITKPAFVDHLIVLDTGPEVVTGSTRMKAGTATKLALNTISTTLMVRSGRVHENLMVGLRATNQKLRDRAARIISTLTGSSREESFALLDAANGDAKIAVVMRSRSVDRSAAERILENAHGRLAAALVQSPS